MLLSPSRKLLLIASILNLVGAQAQPGFTPGVPVTNKEQQTLLPTLVNPNTSACKVEYVNGKKIIPATNSPADCQREMYEQAKIRKAQAIELASKAIQMADKTQNVIPKCVKSVDVRETVCIKTKLLNNIKTKPTYAVTGEENKVYIYKNGKKVMIGVVVQNHFTKKEKPPSDQAQIIDKAKEAYVFNAIGEVLSTKQTKKKKQSECICPGQSVPQTAEGTPLINECHKHECRNYDLFVNILSNTSVAEAPPSEKAPEKKDESKDKKDEGKSAEAAPAA